LRINENMPLLAFDPFARVIAMRIDAGPPFSADLTTNFRVNPNEGA